MQENELKVTDDRYYTSKSFIMLGQSLDKCFNCSYCRARDNKAKYETLPNRYKNLPLSVNMFYGDPTLQIENTINILKKLENIEYKGIVMLITKGDLNKFPNTKFNLDLHFGLSTFGCNSKYDGSSTEILKNNLNKISKLGYKFNIEYRPIINGINDSNDCIKFVTSIAKDYNCPIGYCGLLVNNELQKYIEQNNLPFLPYKGYQFGMKKNISKNVENSLREYAETPLFLKTSCLLSYLHNLEHDYNCHYYRPGEVHCGLCPMKDKCNTFKSKKILSVKNIINIPFEYTIEYRNDISCSILPQCNHPSKNCYNITGNIININDNITIGDVRIIRWLTGCMVQPKVIIWNDKISNVWKEI